MTATSHRRLVGLDVARCLALLGMIATHALEPRLWEESSGTAPGEPCRGSALSEFSSSRLGGSVSLTGGCETRAR